MRGIVICPNIALRRQFEEATAQYNLTLVKRLDSYPSPEAFGRLARAWAPDVVFLSLENHGDAAAFCRDMEAEFPDLQRIGLHSSPDPATFKLALRLHMRDLLIAPFQQVELAQALSDVASHLEEHPINIVGCSDRFPVTASFPSDYVSVTKSIREAQMPANLAAPFQHFAETLFRKPEQEKKRFIERFAVVLMRYGFRTHAS